MPTFVISGSRRITDYGLVVAVIDTAIQEFNTWPTLVIEGGQRTLDEQKRVVGGVDWFARRWAEDSGIKCETVRAEWLKYGKKAGPIRNREMALRADYLIAIPDGESKGTRDMIAAMRRYHDISTSRIFVSWQP